MEAPELNFANTMTETSRNPYENRINPERPPDTAVNIQWGRNTIRNNFSTPCSHSASTMDSSPLSEMDYAKRVATLNNQMDVEMSNPVGEGTRNCTPQQMQDDHKAVLTTSCQHDSSTLLVPPSTIPYEANAPADPNLWDGYFGATSLFGTNEFLLNDAWNISSSLIRIAEFVKQRNTTNWDGNKITQIDSFGEAALTFIQAIHKAGWDKLNLANNISLRQNIQMQFVIAGPPSNDKGKRSLVAKVPPPIPTRLPKKQIEEAKKHWEKRKINNKSTKSFAQAASPASDILKLRDAFLVLPNKKIIEIHNATLNKEPIKGRKIQSTTKGPSRKQAIVPIPLVQANIIMNNAGFHVSSINSQLKGIKSTLRVEFIWSTSEGIIITTNNVPAASDLSTMERYIKSIEGINQSDVLTPRLPQSKLYLKITDISFT